MVEKPSRVKQLTLNHMCKVGLSKEMRKITASVTLHIFTQVCIVNCKASTDRLETNYFRYHFNDSENFNYLMYDF
jgi:hypothetical protein